MRDYKQMQEIERLRKQAEQEEQNGASEPQDQPEAEKYNRKGGGFMGWWEYFKEYYKWPALIIGIVVIAVLIGIRQLSERSDPDLSVMYVGPGYLSFADQQDLENVFADLSGDLAGDYNSDGKYTLNFLDLTVNYAQNAEGYQIMTKDDEDTTYTRFQTELRAGETLLYFLDPHYYEIVKDEGILQPLNVILKDPSVSFDGYGIHIGDLDAKVLPGMERMPSRTVLCLRQSPTEDAISYGRTESDWAHHRDLLELLVAYAKETPDEPVPAFSGTLFYAGVNEIYRDGREPVEVLLSSLSGWISRFSVEQVIRTGSDKAKEVAAKRIRTELRTGDSELLLLDAEAFLYAKEHDLLEPLPKDLLASPAATDGHGLKLNKLALREADGFFEADPDAILCLRKNPENTAETYGRTEENWKIASEIFAKLAKYEK